MDLTRPGQIARLLQQYGIKVRKAWGQNFIINRDIVDRIVSAAELTGTETVLEIGPGLGTMTELLLQKAGRVIAVEIDPLLCRVLRERISHPRFQLIEGDALNQQFSSLAAGPYVVVANLPYYITSPIITKLIEEENPPQTVVVLVQLEVAQRLTAAPGTQQYGSISAYVQYHYDVEMLFRVGAGNFFPPPRVDSAVVRMRRQCTGQRPKNEQLLFRLIRIAFSQRRKMLKGLVAKEMGIDPKQVEAALVATGLPADVRGEKLTVTDFINLADRLEDWA